MNRTQHPVPSLATSLATSLTLTCLLLAALATTGCTQFAEDIATHLAAKDVKTFEEDFRIFETDLVLFRNCLKERGGSCQGNAETPLPHSSQDAASHKVMPVEPGSSQKLATSVGKLSSGHPAAVAYKVLTHPVVQQAATMHNHLRGHQTNPVAGASVQHSSHGDHGTHGGPKSTITMEMKFGQLTHFHSQLL
jgi:hypothetical protein